MRWKRGHRSTNVEDRRGQRPARSGGARGVPTGLLGMIFRRFGMGWGIAAVVGYFAFTALVPPGEEVGMSPAEGQSASAAKAEQDELVSFVSFVLDDAQNTWRTKFPALRSGKSYADARLVIFTGSTPTACGQGRSATGPFYCPLDQKVYIDLGFYQQLRRSLGAPGDFAQAYVIAHEIGHHVQHQTGALTGNRDKGADGTAVRVELQADCYAGVWAHDTDQRKLLDSGDIAEAIVAAKAIGDDTLQRQSGGRVSPESWTHGSSAQRTRWFQRGYSTGDPTVCDSFTAAEL